jgi:hypothetical protein
MDYKKYINQRSAVYFAVIFVLLYIATSFVKFIGQLPILIIISLIMTYYFYTKYSSYTTDQIDKLTNIQSNIQSTISNMINSNSNNMYQEQESE